MQFQSKHILFWLLQFEEIHYYEVCYMQFDAPAISFGHSLAISLGDNWEF